MPRKIRHPKKRAFLAAYAKSGIILKAAEAAGVNRCTPRDWISKDPLFAAEYAEAHDAACDLLEAEATRRGVDGWDATEETVEKKTIPGEGAAAATTTTTRKVKRQRRYSDTCLMARLNAELPHKYKYRPEQETPADRPPPAIDLTLRVEIDERPASLAGGVPRLALEASTKEITRDDEGPEQ